mgnify:CR=1 FL=1
MQLLEQFTRERLESLIDDEDCRVTVAEQEALAQIALAVMDDNYPGIPDGCNTTHAWIEGREIPDSAMTASYDSGAGPIICAVAEVDESLQADGYPVLCWAYIDVVPGMMIDRATNCNITNHVVRWLPVKRA